MDIAADLDFAVMPVTRNKLAGLYRCLWRLTNTLLHTSSEEKENEQAYKSGIDSIRIGHERVEVLTACR
jgi:hypothetical protein